MLEFGKIVIGGRTYFNDLIIYPDRVEPTWFRQDGHLVEIKDLSDVLDLKPKTIVIGTGISGMVKIKPELSSYCKAHGISLIAEPTKEACRRFNKMDDRSEAVFALHLTC